MPWLYSDPATMNYDNIDEPIRELCREINNSMWLRTEESCAGHPTNEPTAWDWNKDLYIRFVLIDEKKLKNLLSLIDEIRKSYGKTKDWHVNLTYDRTDELGSHWYFNLKYGQDIKLRHAAVDIVLRKFNLVNAFQRNGFG